ncbi:MAG: AraC family transcriptional regulator [Rhodothermaceae bacterium]|nr:AraC family transcriptional regulator [Rhodothermaceae bacterium]
MDWELLFIVLLSVGAIQGIVLGVLLLRATQHNRYANKVLAVLLFFLSYQLVVEILAAVGTLHTGTVLYHLFLEYNWVYGPLIFFYVVSFLNPEWRLGKKDWPHLIPFIIEFCVGNFVKTQNLFWDGTAESLSWLGLKGYVLWIQTPIQEVVGAGLIIGYSWFAFKKVRTVAIEYPAFSEKLRWIRTLLYIYVVVAVLVTGWGIVDYFFFDYAFNPTYIYPAYISISILTYILGLLGFMHRNDSFTSRMGSRKSTTGEWDSILDAFEKVIVNHQLYKNPRLSLSEVAETLRVKPYQLTEALNGGKGVPFKEYINECRVNEVLRLMRDPEYQQYTLTAIAFEAGFNSKATFNRTFKKVTGKSPSAVKSSLVPDSTK